MADALVFYDLPWTPDHVDQWVGRVDRLGRETIDPEQPHTRPVPVTVVSIEWRGEFDERMVNVYESSGVFERPLQLDPAENRQISKAILSAGLGLNESLWGELQQTLEDRKRNQDSIAIQQPAAFGTPTKATQLYDDLRNQAPSIPIISKERRLGYVSSNLEDALSRWLALLELQKYYHFHSNKKQATEEKNRTLKFYTLSQSRSAATARLDRVDSYSAPSWVPFFVARKHIQRPPRRTVDLENDGEPIPRPIEFLDHGSPLHDELIDKWIEVGQRPNASHGLNFHSFKVHFSSEHLSAETKVQMGQRYVVVVGFFDPCWRIDPKEYADRLVDALESAKNATQEKMRQDERRRLKLDVESEIRFLRYLMASRICTIGVMYQQEFPEITEELCHDLLTAFWGGKRPDVSLNPPEIGPPLCEEVKWAPKDVQELPVFLNRLLRKSQAKTKAENATTLAPIKERTNDRKLQLQIEMFDRFAVLGKQLENVEKQIAEYREYESERNDAAITTRLIPRKLVIEEQIELSKKRLEIRLSALDAGFQQIATPDYDLFTCLDITVEMIFPANRQQPEKQ